VQVEFTQKCIGTNNLITACPTPKIKVIKDNGFILKSLYLLMILALLCRASACHGALKSNDTKPSPNNINFKINDESAQYDLSTEFFWLEDKTSSFDINKVSQPWALDQFTKNTDPTFNLGYTDIPVWFYIQLQNMNQNKSMTQWFLEIDYPQLDQIDVYIQRQNGVSEELKLGDRYAYKTRPYPSQSHIIPVDFSANEIINVFIRVKTTGPMRMPLSISTGTNIVKNKNIANIAYGIYFGIIVVMVLYNGISYFSFRDKSYLYYIFYVGSFGLMQASITGYAHAYLWPNAIQWVNDSIPVFIGLSILFSLQFSRHFLSLKSHSFFIDKIMKTCCFIAFMIALGSFFISNRVSVTAGIILTLIGTALIFIAGGLSLKHNFRIARFFLIAWSFVLPSAFIYMMSSIELIQANIFSLYSAQIAYLIVIVFLSLALGDRINFQRKENQRVAKKSEQKLQTANNELSHALAKLERSNRLKDQFLSTISHELRTPMNGVEGSLNLITSSNLDTSQKSYLTTAKLSAKDMTSLVESILYFSDMQSGEIAFNKENIELRTLLKPYALKYRYQCQQKGLKFNWHIDDSVPAIINSDGEQLVLVLKNLIDNAIKFTHEGQVSVNISTGYEEQTQQQNLSYSIIDSGSGIPKDQLNNIFNPFQQIDGSPSRNHNGLGIGLAICQQIATFMNGRFHVESEIGRGTEFTFTMPLEPNKNISSQGFLPESLTKNTNKSNNKPKTILVAEDNPVNQLVLKGMLEQSGCMIVTANNGLEVVELLESQPVDLIMMDCQMPLIDGFEATRKIRRSEAAYSNIPIIAVTANAMSGDSVHCLSAGMNDYIKKPVNRDIIEQKVKRWLQHGK
jgi:signal transduction histidine kinase/ActR/RegA family two-component response regulator